MRLQRTRWILHIMLASSCLVIRFAALPAGPIDPGLPGAADVPSWWGWFGSANDLTLFGPDAGDWAIAAREVKEDGFPDVHRLPFYARLTAMAAGDTGNYVFAGHMINVLLSSFVVVLTYALGYFLFCPAVGLGAGILVAVSHELLDAQMKYGVDPSFCAVSLTLLVFLLATHRRHPAASALAGLAAGLTATTHYLGIALAHLLSTTLVFSPGSAWRRINRYVVFSIVAGATVLVMFRPPYEGVTMRDILTQYREGVTTSHQRKDLERGFQGTFALILEELPRGLQRAGEAASAPLARQTGLDAGIFLALMALGLGGTLAGARRIVPRRRRSRHFRWVETSCVLVYLGLLVGLSAARGAARYQVFAIPLLSVLLCGGPWAGVRLVVGLLGRHLGPWRLPLVTITATAAALALPVLLAPEMYENRPGPGPDLGRHEREVGQEIARRFPGDGLLVTPSQEVRYYTRRQARCLMPCPPHDPHRTICVADASALCSGHGDIPYHQMIGGAGTPPGNASTNVEDWVLKHGILEAEFRSGGSRSLIYRIREDLLRRRR